MVLKVVSNEQLVAQEAAEISAVEAQQAQPVIVGLAAYVRQCFEAAKTARQPHENDMLSALRARNGEYDPAILAEIRKQGGSDVYMRITSAKMRSAHSWLKDIYLSIDRPWTADPTPIPSLQQEIEPVVMQQLDYFARMAVSQGIVPTEQELRQMYEEMLSKAKGEVNEEAKEQAEAATAKIDDVLVEGGFYKALGEGLADITTFKVVCIKGPVIEMRKQLKWESQVDPATGQPGKRMPTVVREPMYTFHRVSPLSLYPAPNATSTTDGYLIERHKLYRPDLIDKIGAPGFDSAAIQRVLEEYGPGGRMTTLSVDSAEASALGNNQFTTSQSVAPTIETLEFWGSVQGQMLIDWGMDPTSIVPYLDYSANVWVAGNYVIKAVLNHDPLGRTPYRISSYTKMPGSLWGEGLYEQLKDVQQVCNAAIRALVNNAAIASGPQAVVRVNRLPPGEEITNLYPWKIWQTTDELSGATSGDPVTFFQPTMNADALLGVYDKFSVLADEYSNLPRYMMGDQHVGGAGRTASGLSMLMNAANKGIKNVAQNIDTDIVVPLIEHLYYFLMIYDDDESIKGDINIRARGASGLMLKELLTQRRLEFLQLTTNPIDLQIVKPEGRAAILREIAKGLEMNTNDIVPSDDEIQRQMQLQQQQQQQQQQQAEDEEYNVDYDEGGKMRGVSVRQKKPAAAQSQGQQMRSMTTPPKLN